MNTIPSDWVSEKDLVRELHVAPEVMAADTQWIVERSVEENIDRRQILNEQQIVQDADGKRFVSPAIAEEISNSVRHKLHNTPRP